MNVRMGILAGAVLLAACGSGKATTGSSDRSATASAKPLSVAGVTPGMTAAKARSVLEAAGWKVRPDPGGQTWDEVVQEEVDRRRHSSLLGHARTGMFGWNADKGEEHVSVSVHPTTQGGSVSSIQYRAPAGGRSFDEFRADLRQRFGAPARDGRVEVRYGDSNAGGQYMLAGTSWEGFSLSLSEGMAAEQAWRASVSTAANAILGTPGKSF